MPGPGDRFRSTGEGRRRWRLGSAIGCERGQRPLVAYARCRLWSALSRSRPFQQFGKVTRMCSDRSGGHAGTVAERGVAPKPPHAQPTRASGCGRRAFASPAIIFNPAGNACPVAAGAAHVVADADERTQRATAGVQGRHPVRGRVADVAAGRLAADQRGGGRGGVDRHVAHVRVVVGRTRLTGKRDRVVVVPMAEAAADDEVAAAGKARRIRLAACPANGECRQRGRPGGEERAQDKQVRLRQPAQLQPASDPARADCHIVRVKSRSRRDRAQVLEPVDLASFGKSRGQTAREDRQRAAEHDGGHGASRAAATPDSKAPSSFDALMKTISTAITRPRSSSGVASATIIERMFMLIMSTKPLTARAAGRAEATSTARTRSCSRRRRRRRAGGSGPAPAERPAREHQAGEQRADRRRAPEQAEPDGADVEQVCAKSGASAIAPPKSTAKRSSKIAPRRIGVRRMKRMPARRVSCRAWMLASIGPPRWPGASSGATRPIAQQQTGGGAVDEVGAIEKSRPPIAGPTITTACDGSSGAPSRSAISSNGTSDGGSARGAGIPTSAEQPKRPRARGTARAVGAVQGDDEQEHRDHRVAGERDERQLAREAVGEVAGREREQRQRRELREPDQAQVERVRGDLEDLPADRDGGHLRGRARRDARSRSRARSRGHGGRGGKRRLIGRRGYPYDADVRAVVLDADGQPRLADAPAPADADAGARMRAVRLGRRADRRRAGGDDPRPRGRRAAGGWSTRRADPPPSLWRVRALPRRPRIDLRRLRRAKPIVPGGFAEAVETADGLELPDAVGDAVGTYLEPLACVLRGAERVPRGQVLVVGQGFVGRLFAGGAASTW